VEGLRSTNGFVALQVADEMPGSRKIREGAELPFPFLDAIFAKVAEASVVGLTNRIGGMRFGNTDQKNFFRLSGGAMRSRCDFLPDELKIFPDCGEVGHRKPVKS
jgi:hypothetical protein